MNDLNHQSSVNQAPLRKRNSLSIRYGLLAITAYVIFASPFTSPSRWELIQQKGTLVYGTRTSLLSHFQVEDQVVGYEYQLLKDFCDQHQLQLEAVVYQNNGELLSDLWSGKIDIAGGHLSNTKERSKQFKFTQPISHTAINLVTHFDYKSSDDISDFNHASGKLIANSSYVELLSQIQNFNPTNLSTSADESMFELIRKINKKEIDYTFADSEIIDIYQHFIPGIYQPLKLSPNENVVFLVGQNRSKQLLKHLNQYIDTNQNSGQLALFKNNLLSYLPEIEVADTVTFFDKLQTSWPEIKHIVEEVAKDHDFDPALLAAISYQESHWNPDAVSFSGVKGLMMLTESTAKEVNINDRTNPRESLIGGIRYLRQMWRKIPDRIDVPDRTLFALAAYNVGFGHLEDARILAQKSGKNPDIWLEVEPFLAELNNPMLAHQFNYGMADGKTAAIYVNNIMTYKQLMIWKLQKERDLVSSQPEEE